LEFRDIQETVKNEIENFKSERIFEQSKIGERYYNQENDIVDRIKRVYWDANLISENPFQANNRLPSGFAKLLIKQKVNYSINEDIGIVSEKEEAAEVIEEIIPNWKKHLKQAGTKASHSIRTFWIFYVDEKDGKLKYRVVPARQGIPIYDDDDDSLTAFIRFYLSKDMSTNETRRYAEYYDADNVTYLVEDNHGNFILNRDIEQNPRKHIPIKIKKGNEVAAAQGIGFGRPPVAILENNDELKSDIQPIRAYIDIYDITDSDFANNIEDFQEAFYVLKGFAGDEQTLRTLLTQIKKYKAIPTKTGTDVAAQTMDVPVVARETYMKIAKENIYRFGQGVDMNDLKSGNVTNVMIKAMFANLDLKANDFEQEIQDFWKQIIFFVNRYNEIKNNGEEIDSELIFNRGLMMNEVEFLEANTKQNGNISDKTRLENHPWIENAEKEIDRLNEEKEAQVNKLGGGLDF